VRERIRGRFLSQRARISTRQIMTNPGDEPRTPSGFPSRALSILALVIGGIMLLPGIGAGVCVLVTIKAPDLLDWAAPILAPSFAIGLVGLVLIVLAVQRLRK
jgi:hypothetical protein